VKSTKNETLQTIGHRRSIRLFTKEEVSDHDLNLLLHAANEAPSDCGPQKEPLAVKVRYLD